MIKINFIRYIGVYLGTMVALGALSWALSRFIQYELPPGLATIIPAMLAAMVEGQMLARGGQVSKLEGGPAWKAALIMTGAAAIANIPIAIILLRAPQVQAAFDLLPPLYLLGILATLIALTFLVNRFFLSMGFRSEQRALERKAK